MTKKIKTKQEAIDYLNSINAGYRECKFVLEFKERMYPIYLDDTADLIRWCNEDKQDSEEAENE